MAYFHVRFSSETLSGNLLLLLVSMLMFFRQKERRHPFLWGLWMGLLAGAAFIVRFQVGFALLGFGLWLLVYLRKVSLLSGLGLGVVAMLGVGTAADRWLYGIWTCTPLNYLHENILQGHIDSFGIDPWWYYLGLYSARRRHSLRHSAVGRHPDFHLEKPQASAHYGC